MLLLMRLPSLNTMMPLSLLPLLLLLQEDGPWPLRLSSSGLKETTGTRLRTCRQVRLWLWGAVWQSHVQWTACSAGKVRTPAACPRCGL